MIDEDAGELIADRFMDQHSGNGTVDAARQAADDPALADLLPDLGDHLRLKARIVQSPISGRQCCERNCEELGAVGRVHDLGMELHGVELALLVGDQRTARSQSADDLEALGKRVTRSPWLIQT